MINLLILIIVSIIITQDVEVVKGLKDWIVNRDWAQGKIAVPVSIVFGIVGGMFLGIGITDSILKALTIEYQLPTLFQYFDLASSCLLLSKGSGFIIDTFNKVKEANKNLAVEEKK